MKKEFYDNVFIASAIIFNVLVSFIYLAGKFENVLLLSVLGTIILSLIIPFTITLVAFYRGKEEQKIVIPNIIIIAYFILEILLNYVLQIPFREILSIHVIYSIVFYIAEFSMISIVFNKNRKMGYVMIASFMLLITCLIYLLVG